MLHYIYDYLNNLSEQEDIDDPQAFATKLTTAFFRSSESYLITQVSTELSKGKYFTNFKIVDPFVKNNKVTKLANEYIESFSRSEAINTPSKLRDLKSRLASEYKKVSNKSNPKFYTDFLKNLTQNELQLNVSNAVIDHFIRLNSSFDEQGNAVGIDPIKAMLIDFLSEKVHSGRMRSSGVKAVYGTMGLFDQLVYNKRLDDDGKQAIKEELMKNGSLFKNLALSAKIFTKDVSEKYPSV